VAYGGNHFRNYGVFREPGVYSIYLILGIIYVAFYFKKISYFKLIVFLLALMSTFSTAGYLVLILVLVVFLIENRHHNKKIIYLSFLIFSLTILSLYLYPDIFVSVFSKLQRTSSSYGSTLSRLASVVVNLNMFLNYPLFGAGLSNYEYLFEHYSSIIYSIPLSSSGQSSNTFMSILATYGFALFAIVVHSLYKFSCRLTRSKVSNVLLFVAIGLMFSSGDMRYSLTFYIMIFYGLNGRIQKRKVKLL
jgi:O-antigen ligase